MVEEYGVLRTESEWFGDGASFRRKSHLELPFVIYCFIIGSSIAKMCRTSICPRVLLRCVVILVHSVTTGMETNQPWVWNTDRADREDASRAWQRASGI